MSDPGWDRQTIPPIPRGWLQWKGTNACLDVYCRCGQQCHVDSDFLYFLECCHCHRIYMVNAHVELIELTPPEVAGLDADAIMPTS